jgi:peptidoglycan LD-endopeptidase CwlK
MPSVFQGSFNEFSDSVGGLMPSREIKDCVPELQAAWPKLQEIFCGRFPGWGMILTCTHRSVEEQADLFKKGRRLLGDGRWVVSDPAIRLTNIDGKHVLSEHNYSPARAFDVALKMPDGRLCWEYGTPQWQAIPEIATAVGLESGGAWKTFKDYPHFHIPIA